MYDRIEGLEKDMSVLQIDGAVVRANYVTKADLAALEASIIKYFIGTAALAAW